MSQMSPMALMAALALLTTQPAAAASLAYCNPGGQLSAEQKDRLFRFGAVVKAELERSGAGVALIARSGLDLSRIGLRYSHAGVSLKAGADTPWAVRQLYYACDEKRPRLFDQGIAAFLTGTDDASLGYISLLFLPEAEAAALEATARDNRRALQLLGADYSANAYAFGLRYQNCNQWLAELLAAAWGGVAAAPGAAEGDAGEPPEDAPAPARTQAQRWLRERGYEPARVELGFWLMQAAAFVPWVHRDDHPAEDLQRQQFRVSMPAAIEGFVRRHLPQATRVELCHAGDRVVVRRGWEPIAEGCQPGEGDEVVPLP